MFKKVGWLFLFVCLSISIGIGDSLFVSDSWARGFRSSRSSSSFRSSRSSSSYRSSKSSYRPSSKAKTRSSSSFWRTKGKKVAAKKTTAKSKIIRSTKKKGFGGTSIFDKKQSKAIKTAKSVKAKNQYAKDTAKFKKPAPKIYTGKTMPTSIKTNPIFAKAKIRNTDNYSTFQRHKSSYYHNIGWNPPQYIYNSQPSFGMWDGMFLWMMLDNINDAKYAKMAYNHSNDPGFLEWKKEAAALAKNNDALSAKLAAMETKVATMTGDKDPGYLPEGADATVILAPTVLEGVTKEKVPLVLATGGANGNYYAAGVNLAKKVKSTITVTVKVTAGTMENIILFFNDKVDAFIGQLDGVDAFAITNPDKISKIKSKWIPLYKEPIQMIANTKGKIKKITDLNSDSIVLVGPKGSGPSLTWKRIVQANPKRYASIKYKNASYADAVDMVSNFPNAVMLYIGGLNSSFMRSLDVIAKSKHLRLVEINDKKLYTTVDIDGNKLYTVVNIPSKVYPNLQKGWFMGNDVKSIAVTAGLSISDKWVKKYGQEALDDLTAGIVAMQSEINKIVNGELE